MTVMGSSLGLREICGKAAKKNKNKMKIVQKIK
jgi:hypothetical protein